MHRHQAHALGPFFQDRRFLPASRFRLFQQVLDEAAERQAAGRFVLAGHLRYVQDVGQRLPARLAHGEAGVRAGRLQQLAKRDIHRPLVAPAVQFLEQLERCSDRLEPVPLGRRSGARLQHVRNPERLRHPEAVEIRKQRLVVDGEQRPVQRREDRQPVVRPFDGRERRPDGRHFLTLVERPSANEQVRDVPRLERVGVRARHIRHEILEAAEQHADMVGLDRNPLLRTAAGRGALGDGPAALVEQPAHERAHGIRQRPVDGGARDAVDPVRARHRQGHDRGLRGRVAAHGR